METQTRLSRHNKFISAENIIAILSVSSDDSLHASLPSIYIYIYILLFMPGYTVITFLYQLFYEKNIEESKSYGGRGIVIIHSFLNSNLDCIFLFAFEFTINKYFN